MGKQEQQAKPETRSLTERELKALNLLNSIATDLRVSRAIVHACNAALRTVEYEDKVIADALAYAEEQLYAAQESLVQLRAE